MKYISILVLVTALIGLTIYTNTNTQTFETSKGKITLNLGAEPLVGINAFIQVTENNIKNFTQKNMPEIVEIYKNNLGKYQEIKEQLKSKK